LALGTAAIDYAAQQLTDAGDENLAVLLVKKNSWCYSWCISTEVDA